MTDSQITTELQHEGQTATICLGPPPGNIVTVALMDELSNALSQIDGSRLKLIVVTGQGDHFSYGASVEEHQADLVREMLPRFHALVRQMLDLSYPTLAKVRGKCLGGGFEVALSCSMIAAAEAAEFATPEIKLGVLPPAASVLLPCKVGDSVVCETVLTGEAVSARRLHELGVVNIVAGDTELDDAVDAFVRDNILPKSAAAIQTACRVARIGIRDYFSRHIDAVEKLYLEQLMSTHDANEGIAAFLEKRTPQWKDN